MYTWETPHKQKTKMKTLKFNHSVQFFDTENKRKNQIYFVVFFSKKKISHTNSNDESNQMLK